MKKSYLKYILSLLLFSSNGIVASYIALTSYEIVLLRSLLGSALLIAIFVFSGSKLTALSHKKDMMFITISGLALAADWLLLFEAYARIGVSIGLLINYCYPAIVIALSPLVFKERVTWPKLVALIASLIGVFLISGQAATKGLNVWGLICAGLSSIAFATMIIFSKMSKQVKGIECSMLQLLVAFVAISIYVACKKGLRMQIAVDDWLPILWLGMLNTGGAYYLFFSSIRKLPVQTVAISGYLEPLSTVILSRIFLNETMLPLQIVGAFFIIGGAIFGEYAFQRTQNK